MTNNSNIQTCAIKVFDIFQRLLNSNVSRNELLKDISDDTLLFYMNTLKEVGLDISFSKKNNGYYFLNNNINLLNLNDNDIKIFFSMKKILSSNGLYKDIINYNNFLFSLKQYTNEFYKNKLQSIISDIPFGIDMHEKLFGLQKYIDNKIPLLISYISPNSDKNFFKISPKIIKLRNQKIYLLGYDYSISDSRYLRIDRIDLFKPLNIESFEMKDFNEFVICEFILPCDFLDDKDIEIQETHNNKLIAKVYYNNNFELMQKILGYGMNCKILEPINVREKILQKLDIIGDVYAK